jgi:hypothetical protein
MRALCDPTYSTATEVDLQFPAGSEAIILAKSALYLTIAEHNSYSDTYGNVHGKIKSRLTHPGRVRTPPRL